jgi:uncharacterized protein YjbI with pentapeptide repeats
MEPRDTKTSTPLHVENACCPDAAFLNVNLERARFDDVKLTGATFTNLCLGDARISDANLSGLSIEDCDLAGMRINGILVEDLLKAYEAARN